jgi:hypothetical protein
VKSTTASFPSVRNQVESMVEERRKLPKVDAGRLWQGALPASALSNVEPTHNTSTILCPNSTVRLISPVSLIQRIKRIEWKDMFAVN